MNKKPLVFYIGWDVIFIVSLKIYDLRDIYLISYIKENYAGKTIYDLSILPILHVILIELGVLIIIGALIALLVYIGFQFKSTWKSALLELAAIGIPSFCLATLTLVRHLVPYANWYSYWQYCPKWLYYSSSTQTYVTIGGILLGYELLLFIFRIVKCAKKADTLSEDESLPEREEE